MSNVAVIVPNYETGLPRVNVASLDPYTKFSYAFGYKRGIQIVEISFVSGSNLANNHQRTYGIFRRLFEKYVVEKDSIEETDRIEMLGQLEAIQDFAKFI